MLLTAIVNILIFYFLALRRFLLIILSIIGIALMGFVLFQGQSSIDSVLSNLVICLTFILIVLTTAYAKAHKPHVLIF